MDRVDPDAPKQKGLRCRKPFFFVIAMCLQGATLAG
jgi:hypothetical protein